MDLNEKRNKIIHEVLKEMLKREKEQATLHIVSFIKKQYPECDSFECDRIVDVMKSEKLVEKKERTSVWLTLTEFGKRIAESDSGWLGLVKSQNEQADKPPTVIVRYEKHWYDTPIKVVGFIALISATYFGISDKYNEKTIHGLTDTTNRQKSIIDSLSKEVLYRDTLLLKEKASLRKHVIDSLTTVLKLKK